MKHFFIKILAFFYTVRLRWRGNLYNFKRAVRKAEKQANAPGGRRYYVYFLGGKYRVLNRKHIQALKNKGVIKRQLNTHSMAKVCLYDTMDGVLRHPNPKYNHFNLRP